jgi:outer membrane receptor for ferric coprogen and ferric-rhodotorulic acid
VEETPRILGWDAAGVVETVGDQVTLYASYATIFQPQTELQIDGSNVKPRQGDQMEAGVKSELFDGALTAQASVFRIHDANRAIEDPDNFGFYVGSGEADTNGVEFSVAGSPFEGFEVIAGYAFHETELTTDPTPEQVLTIFGKYSFADGALEGLSLGAGMRAFNGFDSESGGVTITAPGAAVFDLFASYAVTDTVTAQVNVANIFDITYADRINTTARGTYYGAPLTATFSISAAF